MLGRAIDPADRQPKARSLNRRVGEFIRANRPSDDGELAARSFSRQSISLMSIRSVGWWSLEHQLPKMMAAPVRAIIGHRSSPFGPVPQ